MENEALLAKLQEQLRAAVEGHRQIGKDLRAIFVRIDEDGKAIVRLESELKSNAEKDKMRKENMDATVAVLKKEDEDLGKEYEAFVEKFDDEKTARQDFEIEIKASLRAAKWIFGGLSVVSAILVAIFTILTFVSGGP